MPKMSGDQNMIQKYFELLKSYQPFGLIPNPNKYSCLKCSNGFTPKYTGVDIHCYPNMIIKLQSILRKPKTTQEISSLVWELNSKFNNRKKLEINNQMINSIIIKKIYDIQKEYWNEFINVFELFETPKIELSKSDTKTNIQLSNYEKRILFLKIFGKKYRIPANKPGDRVLEAIFSYQDWIDANQPIQIKYCNSEEYIKGDEYDKNISRVYNFFQENKQMINLDNCLVGYKWKNHLNLKIGLNENNLPVICSNDKIILLDWFDGTNMVEPNNSYQYMIPSEKDILIIKNMLGSLLSISLMDCNKECRRTKLNNYLLDIKQFENDFKLNLYLLKSIMVKINTAYDNMITISQVNRMGNKLDESVDYLNEGNYLKILNLLHYCYPGALIIKGDLKFYANTSNSAYSQMINDINYLIRRKPSIDTNLKLIKIKTKLWDHQNSTVKFIISNIKAGKKGFGDASNVGAGKTLTALATSLEIYQMDKSENKILVLLPTEKLYKTWTDEINKHFEGLNLLVQNADGSLTGKPDNSTLNIYVTTMGRNREHPLKLDWGFVIIDECLTVQNKEALQTMEAWKQVINSKYGVLLLSATFFRTRFDKLLYMLKMLNTQLPENKDYLDTILYDSIKVNLPLTKRTWTENLFKKKMDKKFLEKYNQIKQMDISNEQKYIALEKYIKTNANYVTIFDEYIKLLSKANSKIKLLIYANSKSEAELISKLDNVGLYPDISKQHVVVSYANGTYGLNDLVTFNHILTRPPEPDKLPQMKGRLDRPGQSESNLSISYIIIENTIEEAHYLRLELCNRFYSNHIMPLGDFYTLAVTTNNIKKPKPNEKEIEV
jgi:hypothetical protein